MFRLFQKPALAIFILLAACTVTDPIRMIGIIERESSISLWLEYGRSQSPIALSLIETELVSRGERRFGRFFVGQKTASAFGKILYKRSSPAAGADTKNCADFTTSAAAQRYFIQAGGPINDLNNLDADGDGLACEWGAQIRRISSDATQPKRQIYTPRSSYTSRCYTGPRGGTYTITASGNKNYSGC